MNYSQIINDKMNSDIKKRYATILEQEYNIVREPIAEIVDLFPTTSKNKKASFRILAAAMVVMLIGATLFFSTNQGSINPKEMIYEYMAANDLSGINTTRSADSNTIPTTPEHKFALAMNLLQNENYTEAVSAFEKCTKEIKVGEAFYHESKVYLIISLVLNDQNNLAKTLFNSLPENSWERKQLSQIILTID